MILTPHDNSSLFGGGEMGRRICAFDWAHTSLGPLAGWPQSLRTCIRLMLNSRYPMFLWWGAGFINFYNDDYIPVLGARHPEALGQPASRVWAEIWDVLGPQAAHVMQEGQATWNESLLLVMERYGYTEETYFSFSYSPAPDDDGGTGGVFCVCTEDTTKVLGRRRLKTLRDLGERTLVETRTVEDAARAAAVTIAQNPLDMPFALVYLLHNDGRTARLAGTTGLFAGSAPAPSMVELGSKADLWGFHHVLETRGSRMLEVTADAFDPLTVSPMGSKVTMKAVILPLAKTGVQELPAGFLVTGISPRLRFDEEYRGFLDLVAAQIATAIADARAYEEERRRAEALAELDRAKTTFFSNVSHEFRTPLTLMLGPLEELLGKSSTEVSPSTKEQLEIVHRSSMRLLKLVNTLLDFSRIEAGRMRAYYEETDLAAYTAELASNFRSACERAGLSLTINCPAPPPGTPPAYIDRDMWEKMVLNLLSNAFKYTLAGGIEVELTTIGNRVELAVRDTGVGIPAAELPRLFDRFHRVEESRGRTHEGTGIGLALVRELVNLHGGTVRAESELGRGSTFILSIPLGTTHLDPSHLGRSSRLGPKGSGAAAFLAEALSCQSQAERDEPEAREKPLPDSTESAPKAAVEGEGAEGRIRPLVLWADDNADMREYVARLLSGRFEVETVADGQAALERARAMLEEGRPPDLVLSDVMMPRLDGLGLLSELRADPGLRSIPFILLSARAGPEAHIEGLGTGADDYVTKPFSGRELLTRVEAQVKMAALRRDAERSIRESENRLRAFISATNDVVYRMSPDWSELRQLQGRRFVADTLDPSRTWLDTYIHPDDQQAVTDAIQKAIRSKSAFELEHRVIQIDGSLGWTLSRAIPIFDDRGDIVEWFGAASDITARKRAEVALQDNEHRLQRWNEELEQAVTHKTTELLQSQDRLRALAAELNLTELRERKRMATELHDHLQQLLILGSLKVEQGKRIKAGGPPMSELLDELRGVFTEALQYTRTLVSELSPPVLREHGLLAGLRWLADSMKKRNLSVTVLERGATDLKVAEDQAVLLFQSVRELLMNAWKYAGTGEATISLEYGAGLLQLTVSDKGAGFDPAALEAVGAPPAGSSSRFGLFNIRERMKSIGGALDIMSIPGHGTTATLTLPLGAGMTAPGGAALVAGSEVAEHKVLSPGGAAADGRQTGVAPTRARVLLVDDHAMVRQGLRSVLDAHSGIELVGEAGDGAAALAAVECLRPAVVIMDINMPEMNGIEATRQIKARFPDTVVIGLSVNAEGENQDAMKRAGASLLLSKEAVAEELARAIWDVLQIR
ncbi:MAG: response regulator [Nitrospira sp.]|nr:response regulator [Nitrospira sp.]